LLPIEAVKIPARLKVMDLYIGALGEKGQKVGAPVKASVIYTKPTIKFLIEKLAQNETGRQILNRVKKRS
jgi:hypothetical protein